MHRRRFILNSGVLISAFGLAGCLGGNGGGTVGDGSGTKTMSTETSTTERTPTPSPTVEPNDTPTATAEPIDTPTRTVEIIHTPTRTITRIHTPTATVPPIETTTAPDTVAVIKYQDYYIPIDQVHSTFGPNCDEEHWHAINIAVRTLSGEVIEDPGGCGFGRFSNTPILEVPRP